MPEYIGNFTSVSTITWPWDSIDSSGGSLTPSTVTPGTIQIFKDNNTVAITSGITDSRAFGAIVGYHMVTVNLSGATYSTNSDYHAMLLGSSIAGQVVNAALFGFSIKNRFPNNTAVEADLSSILNETSALIQDSTLIKVSLSSILGETTILIADTSALKADSTAIKVALTNLAADTTVMKVSLSSILNETTVILADTSALKLDSTAIKSVLTSLSSRIEELQADTTSLKVSMSSALNQSSALIDDSTVIKAQLTSISTGVTRILEDTTILKVDSTLMKVSLSSLLNESTAIITAISGIPATVLGVVNSQAIDSTITRLEAERIILSGMAGQTSGAGTSAVKFHAAGTSAPAKVRITADLSTLGERTGIVLDGSPT